MVAKLDSLTGRSRAQSRFHPPYKFEHVVSHSNALKQSAGSSPAGAASSNDVIYTKPFVSMTYDYPPTNYDTNPVSKPPDSFPIYSPSKVLAEQNLSKNFIVLSFETKIKFSPMPS